MAADGYTTNPGTGGKTFDSDNNTPLSLPRIKLVHGAEGFTDGDVATSNPLPVEDHGVGKQYKFVAASSTNFALENSVGTIGDEITSILVIPTSSTPGTISIKDGIGSSMTVWAGTGSDRPFALPIRAKSFNGGWSITTGANVTAFVSGQFS